MTEFLNPVYNINYRSYYVIAQIVTSSTDFVFYWLYFCENKAFSLMFWLHLLSDLLYLHKLVKLYFHIWFVLCVNRHILSAKSRSRSNIEWDFHIWYIVLKKTSVLKFRFSCFLWKCLKLCCPQQVLCPILNVWLDVYDFAVPQ